MKLATFDDWKHCITVECGIELTSQYVDQRITALNDANDHHTRKFRQEYGDAHLARVIGWFEAAKSELSPASLTR